MLATLSTLLLFPAVAVSKVEITITTGADDLRSDSRVMVVLEGKTGRKSGGLAAAGIPGGGVKTITLTPPPNTEVADLHHLRLAFTSGRATGFDDHWMLDGIKVEAFTPGRRQIIYQRMKMGTHLKYTQQWVSPFFPTAVTDEMISPGDVWAEFEHGGDDFRPQSRVKLDFDIEDGRAWSGHRNGERVLNDTRNPGARVQVEASVRFPVHTIRQMRIGFESGALTGNDNFHQLDTGDDWSMRAVRFFYRGADGSKKDLGTFPEVNHRFDEGGWWQAPMFRPFKRVPGDPIGAMKLEVLIGHDDIRRLNLPRDQDLHYNSRFDLWFNAPIASEHARVPWLLEGDAVRRSINPASTSFVLQSTDGFPDRWEGRYSAWQRLTKTAVAVGEPFFTASDLFDVSIRFLQGKGGNLLPTQSSGGGLIGDLRQPDNWDLQGLIVSTAAPNNGPWRRIFSDFAINRRMTTDRQVWKSKQFETAVLRLRR